MAIVNHWTFDNVSGLTIYDDVGSDDGYLTDLAVDASGKFDDCAYSNSFSIERYMYAGSIYFTSLSLWIKRGTDGTKVFMPLTSYSSSYPLKTLYSTGSGDSSLLKVNGNPTGFTITDTSWHHLVMVEGSDNDHHWIYLDGVKSSTEIETDFGGIIDVFGTYVETADVGVGGIDNIQVYDDALSNYEVEQLYVAADQSALPDSREMAGTIAITDGIRASVPMLSGVTGTIAINGGITAELEDKFISAITGTIAINGGLSASSTPTDIIGTIAINGGITTAVIQKPTIQGTIAISGGLDAESEGIAASIAGRIAISGGLRLEEVKAKTIEGTIALTGSMTAEVPRPAEINGTIALTGGFTVGSTASSCRLPEYSTDRWA